MQTENIYWIKPKINDYKLQRDRVMRADSLDFFEIVTQFAGKNTHKVLCMKNKDSKTHELNEFFTDMFIRFLC